MHLQDEEALLGHCVQIAGEAVDDYHPGTVRFDPRRMYRKLAGDDFGRVDLSM